jgi:hypothetical protein
VAAAGQGLAVDRAYQFGFDIVATSPPHCEHGSVSLPPPALMPWAPVRTAQLIELPRGV